MGRKPTGVSRGRKSDFTGEKAEWLDGFRDAMHDAGADPGSVYIDAINTFLGRYGYDLPFDDNMDGDPEDNPPVLLTNPDTSEKTRRGTIQKKLHIKLSNYFRNRWKGKNVHTGAIHSILRAMQTMSGPGAHPRCKPAVAVYSKLHYAMCVKPGFDALWNEGILPANTRVSMSQDYVWNCWKQETSEFRAKVEAEGEEMHQVALAEWKSSQMIPERSPEEYHNVMETLNEVGLPMADALTERLGAHVIILVVGPVGSEKGEVCLRIVFSDTTNLQTTRTWAQFDHKGFMVMENSITRYGHAAFSKAEGREHTEDAPPSSTALPVPITLSTALPAPVVPITPSIPLSSIAPIAPSTALPAPNTRPITPATVLPASDTRPITPATALPTPIIAANAMELLADGIDRSEWSESLVEGHAYLVTKQWGDRWTKLLKVLVEHEWSFYHPEEDGSIPKANSRPLEFGNWMKEHRPLTTDYPVGADFGAQLLDWWKNLGPPSRWVDVGEGEGKNKEPSHIASKFWMLDWQKLHKRGRNGVILLLLGLAWWGQSICNGAAGDGLGARKAALAANDIWQFMVDDVTWVLEAVLMQGWTEMEAGQKGEG
ncbi:hypothetical protein B0H14DRAFT_3465340 [Mycena olivaceomarginata]|nr:hypothetical protein B0H14DRAFT_3465340 [Mycena olivaceomarginata]